MNDVLIGFLSITTPVLTVLPVWSRDVLSPSPASAPPTPSPPAVDVSGVESSTNELPLSALTFSRKSAGGADGCIVRGAGRRQRHSIAGQMSYLKMLGLGARVKLPGAAGLFSTAVISGSSSAPNLRVMIPASSASNGT